MSFSDLCVPLHIHGKHIYTYAHTHKNQLACVRPVSDSYGHNRAITYKLTAVAASCTRPIETKARHNPALRWV